MDLISVFSLWSHECQFTHEHQLCKCTQGRLKNSNSFFFTVLLYHEVLHVMSVMTETFINDLLFLVQTGGWKINMRMHSFIDRTIYINWKYDSIYLIGQSLFQKLPIHKSGFSLTGSKYDSSNFVWRHFYSYLNAELLSMRVNAILWTEILAVSICFNENKSSKEPFLEGSWVGSNFFSLFLFSLLCALEGMRVTVRKIFIFFSLLCHFFCPSLSLNNYIVTVAQSSLLALQQDTAYVLGKAILLSDQVWPEFTVVFSMHKKCYISFHFEWL